MELTNANTAETSFVVPENAKSGDTIQLICEVSDNGTPTLTHYQRVLVTVQTDDDPQIKRTINVKSPKRLKRIIERKL